MAEEINLQSKRSRRLAERAKPSLEQGEQIRALFVGQTRIPPVYFWLLLVPPITVVMIVLAFFTRGGVIVVTDRNVYQFSLSTLGHWKKLLHKDHLGEVTATTGSHWSLKIGEGRLLYALGGSRRGVRDEIAALINQGNPIEFETRASHLVS